MLWLATRTSCHLFAFKPDLVQGTNHDQRLTEALNPKQDKAAKLAVILRSGLLIEVGDEFVSVSNRWLDCVSVRLEREIQVATGDWLHVKANQKLAFGPRVTNG